MGLLPDVAADLGVSIPGAGWLVTGHGWLANKQSGSGTGKTALSGNGIEGPQLKQIHSYKPQ